MNKLIKASLLSLLALGFQTITYASEQTRAVLNKTRTENQDQKRDNLKEEIETLQQDIKKLEQDKKDTLKKINEKRKELESSNKGRYIKSYISSGTIILSFIYDGCFSKEKNPLQVLIPIAILALTYCISDAYVESLIYGDQAGENENDDAIETIDNNQQSPA